MRSVCHLRPYVKSPDVSVSSIPSKTVTERYALTCKEKTGGSTVPTRVIGIELCPFPALCHDNKSTDPRHAAYCTKVTYPEEHTRSSQRPSHRNILNPVEPESSNKARSPAFLMPIADACAPGPHGQIITPPLRAARHVCSGGRLLRISHLHGRTMPQEARVCCVSKETQRWWRRCLRGEKERKSLNEFILFYC